MNVPTYSGAMIGHIAEQFTLPIGGFFCFFGEKKKIEVFFSLKKWFAGQVEIDADAGTITMLESAVL